MRQPPIVDRVNTRALESRRVTRTVVHDCTVLEAMPDHLLLTTEASVAHRFVVGQEAPTVTERIAVGTVLKGRLRVDLVTDSILRVRYSEGASVPENPTPMVVGSFGNPPSAAVRVSDAGVSYSAGTTSFEVDLRPFLLRVVDGDGVEVCRIGGRDKNFFTATGLVWDSHSTGISRCLDDGSPLATEVFALRPHEAVYGFGETFNRLNKVGQTIDLTMVEAFGVTSPRSYKSIPFFMSTRGYGVFFNTSARMTAWIGSLCAADVRA